MASYIDPNYIKLLMDEPVADDDLLLASEMLSGLRDNSFYRKQEEAAAELGFSIRYIN